MAPLRASPFPPRSRPGIISFSPHAHSATAPGEKSTAMRALLDLSPEEFQAWLQAQGQPPLRARQVQRWLFAGRAESFEQMTDLPLALRRSLAAQFQVFGTHLARHLRSCDGTNKLLLRLQDEQLIESVLLQE